MNFKSVPIQVSLRHIGLNASDSTEAEKIAGLFAEVFGLPYQPGNSSVFAGDIVEVMRAPYLGTHGHIALGVDSIEETEAYFKEIGYPFAVETAKFTADGRMKAVYLKGEFGGFAVHLLKN